MPKTYEKVTGQESRDLKQREIRIKETIELVNVRTLQQIDDEIQSHTDQIYQAEKTKAFHEAKIAELESERKLVEGALK